jgi:hypothetical protein
MRLMPIGETQRNRDLHNQARRILNPGRQSYGERVTL